jgi:hypothetical protein
MSVLEFKADILINGVNPYVMINSEQASLLKENWRRPMPVFVKVNNKPDDGWRINMMPVGDGRFYLYLDGNARKASQSKVGDTVNVTVEFDALYRSGPVHAIPQLLQDALDRDSDIQARWEKLSPSRQKEVLRYLDKIKSEEIKIKNTERMINILLGNADHFMGRDWVDGK